MRNWINLFENCVDSNSHGPYSETIDETIYVIGNCATYDPLLRKNKLMKSGRDSKLHANYPGGQVYLNKLDALKAAVAAMRRKKEKYGVYELADAEIYKKNNTYHLTKSAKVIRKLNESREKLPDDVIKAFEQLGANQRGAPEQAMLNLQMYIGGGVLSPLVEHLGDLTHRMSHFVRHGSVTTTAEKIIKCYEWLTNEYGFEREMNQNFINNAKYRKTPIKEFKEKATELLRIYAKAHARLVVYNKAQWLARQAAVSVGLENFDAAKSYLALLLQMVKNGNLEIEAMKYKKDIEGKLIPYTGSVSENINESQGLYEPNKKYNGLIPEIKYLPLTAIKRRALDFRPEVMSVSDEVAKNMKYDEPVDVTAFRFVTVRDGEDDDTIPQVILDEKINPLSHDVALNILLFNSFLTWL